MIRKIFVLTIIAVLVLGLTVLPIQAATEDEIEESIQKGLEWLVAQQDTSGGPDDGSWNAYGQLEAGTGLALYKLCDRAYELGYESPFVSEYEYSENVIDGFTWLFNHLIAVPIVLQNHLGGASNTIDDPDTRVNGKGICSTSPSYPTYTTGIMLAAVAASGTPDRLNEASTDFDGDGNVETYQEVAQDMVDYLAFGQVDPSVDSAGNTKEGGWDYAAVNNGVGGSDWQGDQSNTGYAVLGLGEAQAFGCAIPDWVKLELDWWIDWVQDDVNGDTNDGGSWYSYPIPDPGDFIGVNILKTGNLLFQMKLVGDAPDTQRVVDALDYLERHWGDAGGGNQPPGWNGNPAGTAPAQYQAMFCAMKGLEYMEIMEFGDPAIDWFKYFSDAIVAQQDESGAWLSSSGRGEPVIITEWALLTLERVVPNRPPDCSGAHATPDCLWPPNHKFVDISIMGVTDPDDDTITITVLNIWSDEPTASDKGSGGAKHAPDAYGIGTDSPSVRAERSGTGDGRVYLIEFMASDGQGGECQGVVRVNVPHDQSDDSCPAIWSPPRNDATQIN